MSEFVPASHVFLDNPATTVDGVLRFLSEAAVSLDLADDADAAYEALKAREAEGTTGMLGGFAIPHAKSAAFKGKGVVIVKLREGVAWSSMDNVPVTCAIALLVPASEAGTTHLQMLSRVAVALMDDSLRSALASSSDPNRIAELVDKAFATE